MESVSGIESALNGSRATHARPVGIGPVIAGWYSNGGVYWVDVAFLDGSVERFFWRKARPGADRPAKLTAINDRMRLANALRPRIVLAHDQESFSALVASIGEAMGTMHRRGRRTSSGARLAA